MPQASAPRSAALRAARVLSSCCAGWGLVAWGCAAWFVSAAPAQEAQPCAPVTAEERGYLVCQAPAKSDVRVFFANPDGQPYGTFSAINEALGLAGQKLVFAMNAGMYDADYTPIGLYVENGVAYKSANQRSGAGNFHMKPNGVFYVAPDGTAGVMETGRFVARKVSARFATQSGPLLVSDGKLHPRIREDGTSRKVRNGVGVCEGGVTRFAISNEPVTFHEFATLFQVTLKCRDALYLDGTISSVFAPSVNRHDRWKPMGPVVGLVAGK